MFVTKKYRELEGRRLISVATMENTCLPSSFQIDLFSLAERKLHEVRDFLFLFHLLPYPQQREQCLARGWCSITGCCTSGCAGVSPRLESAGGPDEHLASENQREPGHRTSPLRPQCPCL